jgi:hypothetical protein
LGGKGYVPIADDCKQVDTSSVLTPSQAKAAAKEDSTSAFGEADDTSLGSLDGSSVELVSNSAVRELAAAIFRLELEPLVRIRCVVLIRAIVLSR